MLLLCGSFPVYGRLYTIVQSVGDGLEIVLHACQDMCTSALAYSINLVHQFGRYDRIRYYRCANMSAVS